MYNSFPGLTPQRWGASVHRINSRSGMKLSHGHKSALSWHADAESWLENTSDCGYAWRRLLCSRSAPYSSSWICLDSPSSTACQCPAWNRRNHNRLQNVRPVSQQSLLSCNRRNKVGNSVTDTVTHTREARARFDPSSPRGRCTASLPSEAQAAVSWHQQCFHHHHSPRSRRG